MAKTPTFPLPPDKRTLYNWLVPFLGYNVAIGSCVPVAVNSDGSLKPSLGSAGSVFISDTEAHTGVFNAIQVISATTITTLVGVGMSGYDGKAIPAGTTIYGPIASITLTSGSAIAYNA
jgi:hypothetical protein